MHNLNLHFLKVDMHDLETNADLYTTTFIIFSVLDILIISLTYIHTLRKKIKIPAAVCIFAISALILSIYYYWFITKCYHLCYLLFVFPLLTDLSCKREQNCHQPKPAMVGALPASQLQARYQERRREQFLQHGAQMQSCWREVWTDLLPLFFFFALFFFNIS